MNPEIPNRALLLAAAYSLRLQKDRLAAARLAAGNAFGWIQNTVAAVAAGVVVGIEEVAVDLCLKMRGLMEVWLTRRVKKVEKEILELKTVWDNPGLM